MSSTSDSTPSTVSQRIVQAVTDSTRVRLSISRLDVLRGARLFFAGCADDAVTEKGKRREP
jgi:hypothetical protein